MAEKVKEITMKTKKLLTTVTLAALLVAPLTPNFAQAAEAEKPLIIDDIDFSKKEGESFVEKNTELTTNDKARPAGDKRDKKSEPTDLKFEDIKDKKPGQYEEWHKRDDSYINHEKSENPLTKDELKPEDIKDKKPGEYEEWHHRDDDYINHKDGNKGERLPEKEDKLTPQDIPKGPGGINPNQKDKEKTPEVKPENKDKKQKEVAKPAKQKAKKKGTNPKTGVMALSSVVGTLAAASIAYIASKKED